jgi:hypothetical protein
VIVITSEEREAWHQARRVLIAAQRESERAQGALRAAQADVAAIEAGLALTYALGPRDQVRVDGTIHREGA